MISRRRFSQMSAAGAVALTLPRPSGASGAPDPLQLSYTDRPPLPVHLTGIPRGAGEQDRALAVRQAALDATDFSWLSRGDTVLIKVVCNSGNDYPATTDPVAVRAMVELLREKGAGRVIVGDMSGVESVRFNKDSLSGSSRELMDRNGLARAATEAGAEVVAFEESGWDGFHEETPREGTSWEQPILMPNVLDEADHVILMPRCGRHVLAGSTLGLKASVGWWRHDSRLQYHNRAATFSAKTADSTTVPSLADKQRLVLTSATKVLTTFGPDQGFIAEPETGLVLASPSVVSHDMVSLAWLLHNQQTATPADERDGMFDDPNRSSFAVDMINRVVNVWLGGVGDAFSAQRLERYDMDTIWQDRVLARAFGGQGGVPRLDLQTDNRVPAEVRSTLTSATTL